MTTQSQPTEQNPIAQAPTPAPTTQGYGRKGGSRYGSPTRWQAMTTQIITADQATDRTQPTAADMANATPIVTLETVLVCGGVTALLTAVANIFGLIVGLVITGLVISGNAQVRQISIENAIADRLEREATHENQHS